METDDGKVSLKGGRTEGQGGLGHDVTCRRTGGEIEGNIYAMRILWDEHKNEEDWVFLLIDARNAFNEENQKSMIWAVQHEWPSGAQFTFN